VTTSLLFEALTPLEVINYEDDEVFFRKQIYLPLLYTLVEFFNKRVAFRGRYNNTEVIGNIQSGSAHSHGIQGN
jgi:hypothetical protein